MPVRVDATLREPIDGVLFDLLMAVMNSMEVWSAAAGDRRRGLAWRDAVTARMIAHTEYVPFEDIVVVAGSRVGLAARAATDLFDRWQKMSPWPDSAAIARLTVPYGFVTNCSTELAVVAADRAGLRPQFTLSAEEAGSYKPDARIYLEACRRLDSRPERTLFVAGSVYDSEGAQRAGLRAHLVARRPDQPAPSAGVVRATSIEQVVAWHQREIVS
jgi:2-haloacid dehalogenase